MKRIALLLVCVLAGLSPASAQDPATAFAQGFAEVSGWILKSAEMVPADKYTYRPTKDVRTYGELLAHIADGYNYFCGRAAGSKVDWSDATEKGPTDKATVTAKLKTATDGCTAAHKKATPGHILLIQNYGHTNLHYGNVITYMRMLGLKPPSS